MTTQVINLNGNGKVVVARTEIYAPYLNEVLAFALPMVGPSYFNKVMTAIDQEKLARPTTAQTLSLVDLALKNKDDEHCQDLLSKFRNNYFWTATENLWTPEEVIVYDNVDGKMPTDRKSLLKRHKDGDKAVRVVPYGFKTEAQSVDELMVNPYVIAQIGDKEMIEVVQRVASEVSSRKPYVLALNKPSSDDHRYTALYSDCIDGWLFLDGYCVVADRDGYASGIVKSEGGKR